MTRIPEVSQAELEKAGIALMEQQGNAPERDSAEWEGALGNAEADVCAVLRALGIEAA